MKKLFFIIISLLLLNPVVAYAAIGTNTIWEVQTGGSDSNGGGFNPANANMPTNGAATSANTASPVFTSATYNFVAGDVGSWLYVKSGTNWTPGWYKIASVASNAATLSADIGTAILSSNNETAGANTVVGCATTASPTSATWTIDRSQQIIPQVAFNGTTITGTTVGVSATITIVGYTVQVCDVGNIVKITGGTNFSVSTHEIVSVSTVSNTWTLDASETTGAGTGMTGNMGACHVSPGQGSRNAVAGNGMHIKSGTYSLTTVTAGTSGGTVSWPAQSSTNAGKIYGYNTTRMDGGTRPLLQAGNAMDTFTIFTTGTGNHLENINFDGASLNSSRGVENASGTCYKCKASNCTNTGFHSGLVILCEGTGCSALAAIQCVNAYYCYSHDNTFTGISNSGSTTSIVGCISVNNTGSSSHGFDGSGSALFMVNCTAYGNGGSGIRFSAGSSTASCAASNCISYGNSGYGVVCAASYDHVYVYNCALGNNTLGTTNNIANASQVVGTVTLTANPFNSTTNNDYSLNAISGGGLACRNAGIVGAFPGGNTTGHIDIGAVQSLRMLQNRIEEQKQEPKQESNDYIIILPVLIFFFVMCMVLIYIYIKEKNASIR